MDSPPDPLTSAARSRAGRTVAALLALLVVALTGCTGDSTSGYVEVEDDRLAVERPEAWQTTIAVTDPWSGGWRPAPDSVEQMQVSGDFGEYATAGEAVGTLIGRAQLEFAPFTVVETRDVEVEGATTAQVVRYTIPDAAGGTVSGTWIVAARWPYPQSVAVSLLAPQHDPELERRVLDSLRLRPVLD